MTTTAPHLSRAAQVAEVHLAGINASRKKCGLALLTASELAREFADVDRPPVRAKGAVQRPTPETDALWGSIVSRLNMTIPASRTPIAVGRTPPATSAADGRVDAAVDWGSIASVLNEEAGLTRGRSR
jgi:hypothetical protein